jgi:exosome complex exonuclease RRP6
MDDVIERTNMYFDEANGLAQAQETDEFVGKKSPKNKSPHAAALAHKNKSPHSGGAVQKIVHLGQKPQARFYDEVDNSRETPFIPPIFKTRMKPHAAEPLPAVSVVEAFQRQGSSGEERLPHPYKTEIGNALKANLDGVDRIEMPADPVMPVDEYDCFWVASTLDLEQAIAEMKVAKEIAIDLEHNDMRSYQGLTCLLQISTRAKNYIIDPLVADVRKNCHLLNLVFADPNIVKVLHGAKSDVIWLQVCVCIWA